jgi:hypothetical protein
MLIFGQRPDVSKGGKRGEMGLAAGPWDVAHQHTVHLFPWACHPLLFLEPIYTTKPFVWNSLDNPFIHQL